MAKVVFQTVKSVDFPRKLTDNLITSMVSTPSLNIHFYEQNYQLCRDRVSHCDWEELRNSRVSPFCSGVCIRSCWWRRQGLLPLRPRASTDKRVLSSRMSRISGI